MHRNPYGDHLDEQVYSANPVELTALLTRALQDSVRSAMHCIAVHDISGRSRQITRAIAILSELSSSLNPSADDEYFGRASALYEFLCDRIRAANATQSEKALQEAEAVLQPLVEAWEQLASASWESEARPLVETRPGHHRWEPARLAG